MNTLFAMSSVSVDSGNIGHLLIQLVIVGLIMWVIWWALGAIGVPEPFNKVIRVILILVVALYLINVLLSLSGSHGIF